MPVENGGYKIVWNIESWKNIRYIMLWEEKIQIQQITDRQRRKKRFCFANR
jgi:hypothetical protein